MDATNPNVITQKHCPARGAIVTTETVTALEGTGEETALA